MVGSSPSLSLQLDLLGDESHLFKKLHTNLFFCSSKSDEVLAEWTPEFTQKKLSILNNSERPPYKNTGNRLEYRFIQL